ncbi:Lnb N-terminal periplasmic domain-containing protein [Rhodanobacter glycinis]|uniref:Lnb N-terminal periplasmic domain-containing protein n=1 Tax=Rhodanobacter glycinis TaxID=582702 RepID=UPI003F7EF903
MTKKLWMMGRAVLFVATTLIAVLSGAWGALALWYQLPGGAVARTLGSTIWALAVIALAVFAISRRSWLPLGVYMVMYAALLIWWASIAPSNNRVWSDDVARMLTGRVQGNAVTLDNVRDFTWRTDADYDARWETRHYDLDRLASADAVLSYWGSKAIAHAMISFGFDDGSHVVFSVEIRKKRGDQYSSIGGFFRQFETTLVAADEHDIIRVRTNVRGEDDYLYPLRMDKATMRALFLSYVQAANTLSDTPAFYNTITSNCTTIVYRMARQIDSGLPWDMRLLLTGYLPEYLYKVGALDRSVSVEQLRQRGRITDRARSTVPGEDFSKAIRTGLR